MRMPVPVLFLTISAQFARLEHLCPLEEKL